MKRFATAVAAMSMSLALAGGAAAQQAGATPLQPGETAMEFAQRIDACNGAEIVSAAFNEARTEVRVQCLQSAAADGSAAGQATAGMSGGLGTTGTIAIGIAVAVGLAAAAGGGGSSSTTTTN